jgi:hypothetical protein
MSRALWRQLLALAGASDLGDELDAKLADFCAAYYKANKTEV